jgi:hypothetical protein
MDVLGGVASITQLIAYGRSVTRCLVELYNTAQEGPAFCRDQSYSIRFLLASIQRICRLEAPDIDSILPILIAIANLASSLLNLLNPQGILRNKWLWVSKSQEIEKTFRALGEKTNLLQLHVAERTYTLVGHLKKDIQCINRSMGSHQFNQISCVRILVHRVITSILLQQPSYIYQSSSAEQTSSPAVAAFTRNNPSDIGTITQYRQTLESAYTSADPTTIADPELQTAASRSSTSVPSAATKQFGSFTFKAHKNITCDSAKMKVGNGWGQSCTSANVEYSENEAGVTSEQTMGNAGEC